MANTKTTGLPRIVASLTTASADDALAVLAPRAVLSIGELVNSALRSRPLPVDLIYDAYAARLYVTEDAATAAAWLDELAAAFTLSVLPDSAGFLTHWTVLFDDLFGGSLEYFHPANKRNIQQVCDAYLRTDSQYWLIASQTTPAFQIIQPTDAAAQSAALAAVVPAVNSFVFDLTLKTPDHNIFE